MAKEKSRFLVDILFQEPKIRKSAAGRKAGSGSRPDRLNIRCSLDLTEVLQALREESWSYTGKSNADIIHAAVKSLARTQFTQASEDLEKAIESL